MKSGYQPTGNPEAKNPPKGKRCYPSINENKVAHLIYEAFHNAKNSVPFHVVSRRSTDESNQTYLETSFGKFIITVKEVNGDVND
jgi:hypothetical protein